MKAPLFPLVLLLMIAAPLASCAADPVLAGFVSDGCSLFPDGRMGQPGRWCDCCFMHDIAYWQGGSRADRKRADEELRECVLKRTGSRPLATAMFEGVRAGGHPAFPTWYRWGYGWRYGRGYAALTEQERKQVAAGLAAYYSAHPAGYCGPMKQQ